MDPILSYQIWMNLPPGTRHLLATYFNIPKTGSVTVEYRASGNVVTSDGYTPDDLRAITVAKLQDALKTDETDFYAMVEIAIENIDFLIDGTYEPYETPASDEETQHSADGKETGGISLHKVNKKRAAKKRAAKK